VNLVKIFILAELFVIFSCRRPASEGNLFLKQNILRPVKGSESERITPVLKKVISSRVVLDTNTVFTALPLGRNDYFVKLFFPEKNYNINNELWFCRISNESSSLVVRILFATEVECYKMHYTEDRSVVLVMASGGRQGYLHIDWNFYEVNNEGIALKKSLRESSTHNAFHGPTALTTQYEFGIYSNSETMGLSVRAIEMVELLNTKTLKYGVTPIWKSETNYFIDLIDFEDRNIGF